MQVDLQRGVRSRADAGVSVGLAVENVPIVDLDVR